MSSSNSGNKDRNLPRGGPQVLDECVFCQEVQQWPEEDAGNGTKATGALVEAVEAFVEALEGKTMIPKSA